MDKSSGKDTQTEKRSFWNHIKRVFSKSDAPYTSSTSDEREGIESTTTNSDDSQEVLPKVDLANDIDKETTQQEISSVQPSTESTEDSLEEQEEPLLPYDPRDDLSDYHYPTLDLLNDNRKNSEVDTQEMEYKTTRLVELLRSFGIEISSIKTAIGPRITFFEISLAPGLKFYKVKELEDDIAVAFYSHDVHIIAPIQGKNKVGIEVPNRHSHVISMRSILGSDKFQTSTMELPCAIGKTLDNNVFMFDLALAPHVLIAGSTGQGKTVTLNAIILSLLFKKHPAELKFVIMQPYGLEFGPYSEISHSFLAAIEGEPAIIYSSKQAVNTLKSLCVEMDDRYELLKMARVRSVYDYNTKFKERYLNPSLGHRYLPIIVVIIDEYEEFLTEEPQGLGEPLRRLARLARTVGIHLILTTKRPTADIITGDIKANFTTRIAFKLPGNIDSHIILDNGGAEELTGEGEMLFKDSSTYDCIRVQGAFVDEQETNNAISFISNQQSYDSCFPLPNPYYYRKK